MKIVSPIIQYVLYAERNHFDLILTGNCCFDDCNKELFSIMRYTTLIWFPICIKACWIYFKIHGGPCEFKSHSRLIDFQVYLM